MAGERFTDNTGLVVFETYRLELIDQKKNLHPWYADLHIALKKKFVGTTLKNK